MLACVPGPSSAWRVARRRGSHQTLNPIRPSLPPPAIRDLDPNPDGPQGRGFHAAKLGLTRSISWCTLHDGWHLLWKGRAYSGSASSWAQRSPAPATHPGEVTLATSGRAFTGPRSQEPDLPTLLPPAGGQGGPLFLSRAVTNLIQSAFLDDGTALTFGASPPWDRVWNRWRDSGCGRYRAQ